MDGRNPLGRSRFLVAGGLIVAAVLYLIISSTADTARYYMTVSELAEMGDAAAGRNVTVSGAVLGESIAYDASIPRVTFSIAHVPADSADLEAAGGLAEALYRAANDPDAPRLDVVYDNVLPDLLRDHAQAIVRGRLRDDGRFEADQVLLKCPSRYEEDTSHQDTRGS
jgi:cytochrome c-type biogenesis protein CcmE